MGTILASLWYVHKSASSCRQWQNNAAHLAQHNLLTCGESQGANWNGQVDNINWHPRAFRLRNFLTPAECDFLIEKVHDVFMMSTARQLLVEQPEGCACLPGAAAHAAKGQQLSLVKSACQTALTSKQEWVGVCFARLK